MKDIKDFYILGEPIETEIGQCQFLKVKEYPDYFSDLELMGLTKQHIIYDYQKLNKNGEFDELIDELIKTDLYEIVLVMPQLITSYSNIFKKVFGDTSVLTLITQENFNYYRSLILRMNCIKEEEINPNPEIQAWIDKSKEAKSLENEKITFADIVSSVVTFSGKSFDEVNNWSLYQLHHVFYRISHFKNYDTSILFSTVSTEKINIQSWCKHIDLFEKEKHSITRDELKKKTKVFDQ